MASTQKVNLDATAFIQVASGGQSGLVSKPITAGDRYYIYLVEASSLPAFTTENRELGLELDDFWRFTLAAGQNLYAYVELIDDAAAPFLALTLD